MERGTKNVLFELVDVSTTLWALKVVLKNRYVNIFLSIFSQSHKKGKTFKRKGSYHEFVQEVDGILALLKINVVADILVLDSSDLKKKDSD